MRRRFRLQQTLVLLVILSTTLTTGCFTTGLRYAARERTRFATITAIDRAWIVEETVFVDVRIARHGKTVGSSWTLAIPLDDPDWPPEGYPADRYQARGLALTHPSVKLLRAATGPPPGAVTLPIHFATVDELDELENVVRRSKNEVVVYSVKYAPPSDSYRWNDPLYLEQGPVTRQVLLIVREAEGLEGTAILDLEQTTYRRWGFYALTPVTVAADVVTLPLQIFLGLMLFDCERGTAIGSDGVSFHGQREYVVPGP